MKMQEQPWRRKEQTKTQLTRLTQGPEQAGFGVVNWDIIPKVVQDHHFSAAS